MLPQVAQLCIYPIKSTRGLSLSRSAVTSEGMAFDRRFMLADEHGRMLTGRALPRLVQIQSALVAEGLLVTHPDMPPLTLAPEDFSGEAIAAQVWKDKFEVRGTHQQANDWFSALLGRRCQLLYTGPYSPRFSQSAGTRVSFADGFPLLVVSQASLEALNARCDTPHHMAQFRPNLVLTDSPAFAEDGWSRIRIGEVELSLDCPCSRCIFTTRDAKTGALMADKEPLNTLSQFRKDGNGNVNFGMNATVIKGGVLEVGAPVDVLENRVAETYAESN